MLQDWFVDAKFGVFLHWGIYSTGRTSESWDFFTGRVPYDEYMAQAAEFTAEHYDPDAWAHLIAQAGAKYAVLTTKHHDGFALWPTKENSWNAIESSPAGRDLVGPFCEALRKVGVKVGLYYSHLDWSHPDYASVLPLKKHWFTGGCTNRFGYPQNGEDPQAWERFLAFHRAQLKELCVQYKPDLLWFDGDWERDDDQWRFAELREQLHEWAPGVVLNSRMGGSTKARLDGEGDYMTPEQAIPLQAPPKMWEFCCTTNDHWGYFEGDDNFKPASHCIRMLAECAGMGGNLLLNIGPKADGSLPSEPVEILEKIGRWTQRHAEALYGTRAGLPNGYFYGASTLSSDQTTIYLFDFSIPRGEIAVKGIRNEIKRISVVGSGAELKHRKLGGAPWAGLPGILWIEVPQNALDADATVFKIELEGPLDLHFGIGEILHSA